MLKYNILLFMTFCAFVFNVTAEAGDYCSLDRLRSLFNDDPRIRKDIPHWKDESLSDKVFSPDDEGYHNILDNLKSGNFVYDKNGQYEKISKDDYLVSLTNGEYGIGPELKKIGPERYLISDVQGTGDFLTDYIAYYDGKIAHIAGSVGGLGLRPLFDGGSLYVSNDLLYGTIDQELYVFELHYIRNEKDGSFVAFYSLSGKANGSGDVREICRKTYTISDQWLTGQGYRDRKTESPKTP